MKLRNFSESFVFETVVRSTKKKGLNWQSHVISANEASLRHNCFEISMVHRWGGGGGGDLCKLVNHASSLRSPPQQQNTEPASIVST